MQLKLLIPIISLLIVSSLSVNNTEFRLRKGNETNEGVFVLPTSSSDEADESLLPHRTENELRIIKATEGLRNFLGRNPILTVIFLGFLTGVLMVIAVFLLRAWCSKRRFRAKMLIADDLYDTTICSQKYAEKTVLPNNHEVTMQLISAESSMA
ncbi:unnamed protein product [Caenorhabditis angaria]|uniref:Uncharacterized protein n=1 Tax=Caenorhabditis angaria TaxID=860376 RepID=A0A9P1MXI9_9PELO|nr:unnamed protein product [Caenorhabditis angaria]